MAAMGMSNEDAARAAMTALGEVVDLMRRAVLSVAEAEPEGIEGIYVREQLGRIKDHAEWLREHLENLQDADFVRRQAKRMSERDARERGGA
jgi:hypothetical protein